jgi:cytochrome c peroxidase
MLAGLSTEHTLASAAPAWRWNLPAHFKPPRVPADNPMSEERFQLGRRLFYDTRLSGNGTQACASCHFQHLAFTDGKAVSTGPPAKRPPATPPASPTAPGTPP